MQRSAPLPQTPVDIMKYFALFSVLSFLAMPVFADTAALAMYADDARVVWPGIQDEARGKPAIRALIESTLRSFPKDSRLTLKSQDTIALGDNYIATVSHWEQSYSRDDGSKAISEYRATEILWVKDGTTLYVVDHASAGQ